MSNSYFQFKQFTIQQDRCAMKVTTDGCLFGSLAPTLSKKEGVIHVLDIGTGTGLLALMFAQAKPQALFDAIEIEKDTFEQAKENVAASPWADRINVIHADAKEYLFPSQYDVIISNPPFYENELTGTDRKKKLAHHHSGLLLPELFAALKKNLKPDGVFFLLLPFKRNEEIRKLVRANELDIRQLIFVRQSNQHDFFRIILEGRLKSDPITETMIDEISIKHDPSPGSNDQYTPAFVSLLKDYYLHL